MNENTITTATATIENDSFELLKEYTDDVKAREARVDKILKTCRDMKPSDITWRSTGVSLLDLSFMLVNKEINFVSGYTKSESAIETLDWLKRDVQTYRKTFYNDDEYNNDDNENDDDFTVSDRNYWADSNTTLTNTADKIVMDVYIALLENGLDGDSIWTENVSVKKLSRETVGYTSIPRVKEKVMRAVEMIDDVIMQSINDEKKRYDTSMTTYEQKTFEDDGETFMYFERKPCTSVFSDDIGGYVDTNGQYHKVTYHQLTLDIETETAFSKLSADCKLTVGERKALKLYFVHKLSVTACRKHMTSEQTKTSAPYVKKSIANGLKKVISVHPDSMSKDIHKRIEKDNVTDWKIDGCNVSIQKIGNVCHEKITTKSLMKNDF